MLTYYRGRVALYQILKALGIQSGDEVALQAFTCIAVPEAILALGAVPRFIDIDEYNMSPVSLRERLTKRTKAIIIQHTFGIPANMTELMAVAGDVPVVEDCCHTFLSKHRGQVVGSFGVAGFHSYEWGKPLVVGVGGSAVPNQEALRARLEEQYLELGNASLPRQIRLELQFRAFSLLYRPQLYWPLRRLYRALGKTGAIESNYNVMNNEPAADFGMKMSPISRRRLNFDRLQEIARYSDRIISIYRQELEQENDKEAVYARYPLRVGNKAALLEIARRENIELADWYISPVHPLKNAPYYLPCPNAEKRCTEVVTLPTHQAVTESFALRASRMIRRYAEFARVDCADSLNLIAVQSP